MDNSLILSEDGKVLCEVRDKSIKSINIPNGVTVIGSCAFKGCTSLTSINIPNSVTEIGYEAFKGCTNLKEIHIPVTVTGINYPFEGCVDPATIYYGGTVAQWHAILRSTYLGDNLQDFVVICTDGKIETK